MALIFELTQLSPTMEEGTFVRWTKKVGDVVEPGDILAEVETDKAVMEMEAYDSGILLVQLSKPGDRMPVGSPMGIIGEAGEDVHTLLDQARERLKAGPPAEKTDAQDAEEDAEIIARHEKAAAEPAPVVPEPSVPAQARSAAQPPRTTDGPRPARVERSGRILASPLARRIAEDKNVDLSRVKGSGPGGRITREDVLRSLDSRPAGVVKRREDRRIDISSMRRVIARRLHDAKNNIPHFYLNMEIDATAVEQLRRELNADLAMHRGEEAPRVSLNDFIVRLMKRGMSANTVRHNVIIVAQFFRRNGRPGLTRQLHLPERISTLPREYSEDDLGQFFGACDACERALFSTFLLTGMREQEVMHLCWLDINLRLRTIRVTAKPEQGFYPKRWEEREIPIANQLVSLLKGHPRTNSPFVFPSPTGNREQNMLRRVKEVAVQAGLKTEFDLKTFRSTFATRMLRAGFDVRTVQHWMGHKSLETTMRYLVPATEVHERLDQVTIPAAPPPARCGLEVGDNLPLLIK